MLSEKTITLLQKVKAHILAEPRRLNMDDWWRKVFTEYNSSPPCGTVGCIAGWANLLSENPMDADTFRDDPHFNACNVLGIERDKGYGLFYVDDWPPQFRDDYADCYEPREFAEVTARRIDAFIETEGGIATLQSEDESPSL